MIWTLKCGKQQSCIGVVLMIASHIIHICVWENLWDESNLDSSVRNGKNPLFYKKNLLEIMIMDSNFKCNPAL